MPLLHPRVDFNDFNDDTLTCMRTNSPDLAINHAYYKENVEEYYIKSGGLLHHILIATETNCVICGSVSKPEPSKIKTIKLLSTYLLGKSLNQER